METLKRAVVHNCRILAFALVLFVVGGSTAWADSGSGSFVFLAGSGPPCSIAPGFCPDITRAANGDTIEVTGAGTLSIFPKSVAGGGAFTHKNPAGGIIAFGVWTAKELLSFSDYGTAVPFFPPNVHGGLAIMRVHLTPSTGGAGVDAILEVDCGINQPGFNFDPSQPGFNADVHKNPEGVRLAVEGGPNFNEKVNCIYRDVGVGVVLRAGQKFCYPRKAKMETLVNTHRTSQGERRL